MSEALRPTPRGGDLIIRADRRHHPETFVLADAISGEGLAMPFEDFAGALQCAKVLAEPRQVAIWREIPALSMPVLVHRPL